MYTPFKFTNVRFIHEPSLSLPLSFSLCKLAKVRHDQFQAGPETLSFDKPCSSSKAESARKPVNSFKS